MQRTEGGPDDDYCTSNKPFFFSVDLPEGNYRVSATLGDTAGESHTVIKAESRRLVLEPISTKKGELKTVSFTVNIRNALLPDGGKVRLKPHVRSWCAGTGDDRLTLGILANGSRSLYCVAALEIQKVDYDGITVFSRG